MAGKSDGVYKFGETIATPPGIISYPNVFEPREDMNAKLSYSCSVLVPKVGADLSNLIIEIMKPVTEHFGNRFQKPSQFGDNHCPIRDGDNKELGDPANGHWIISAKSTTRSKPWVLDRSNRAIDAERSHEIYGGMIGYMWVKPMTYEMPASKGVKLLLVGLVKMADGEPFGGSSDRFNPLTAKTPYQEIPDYLKARVSVAPRHAPAPAPARELPSYAATSADQAMMAHLNNNGGDGEDIPF